MKRVGGVLSVFFCFQCSFGVSPWEIDVNSIQQDGIGNIKLSFQHIGKDGAKQTSTLTDTDGIATLATTQLMLVSKIPMKQMPSDTLLNTVLPEGGSRILSAQHDALEKFISALKEAVDDSKVPLHQRKLVGTDLTIEQALDLGQSLLERFSAKKPWTLGEVMERGRDIEKIIGGGGPYSVTQIRNGRQQTSKVLLHDQDNPKASFLSGAIAAGVFYHTLAFSKSQVWITGDLSRVAQDYENSRGAKGFGISTSGNRTRRISDYIKSPRTH